MSFTTWCHKTCFKKACILLNKTCDMIQNYHFIKEQYYEFILLHKWYLLFPWQGLGTDNAMLDPISLCLAICWHSLSNYCYSFTWRKKPIKTMYWFHTNKLKEIIFQSHPNFLINKGIYTATVRLTWQQRPQLTRCRWRGRWRRWLRRW